MLKLPSIATLRKYGLSVDEWKAMAAEQSHSCFVCRKPPRTGRLCIDHEHVRGWKAMPPEERKRWVRGLLCWFCNHYYVGRALTVDKAKRVVEYLEQYQRRKA